MRMLFIPDVPGMNSHWHSPARGPQGRTVRIPGVPGMPSRWPGSRAVSGPDTTAADALSTRGLRTPRIRTTNGVNRFSLTHPYLQ